eukprot:3462246-Prymnesium_polylepis.1
MHSRDSAKSAAGCVSADVQVQRATAPGESTGRHSAYFPHPVLVHVGGDFGGEGGTAGGIGGGDTGCAVLSSAQ